MFCLSVTCSGCSSVQSILVLYGILHVHTLRWIRCGPFTRMAHGEFDYCWIAMAVFVPNGGLGGTTTRCGAVQHVWRLRNAAPAEFTRGNVVVEMDGRLLTPPLHCGLLPGTLRAEMLSQGKLAEAIVRVEQLESVSRIWFINSVRGMLSVNLTTLEAIEGCEHVD